jgi:hypothetical protein
VNVAHGSEERRPPPETGRAHPLQARKERAVRIAAGLLAVIGVPASVVPWLGPWTSEGLVMRLWLPAFAALFVTVAATGQGSRASRKALEALILVVSLA